MKKTIMIFLVVTATNLKAQINCDSLNECIHIPTDTTICLGDTMYLSGYGSQFYTWTINGTVFVHKPGDPILPFIPASNQVLTVGFDFMGCYIERNIRLNVIECLDALNLGIETVNLEDIISVSSATVPCTLINITPEYVCPDEMVSVCLTIDQAPPPNVKFQIVIYFTDGAVNHQYQLFDGFFYQLTSTDSLMTGEPIYCFPFKIPMYFSSGQWCAKLDPTVNDVSCIWVKNIAECNLVDLPTHTLPSLPPTYTNLFTLIPTEFTPNTVLIEQRGDVRRKRLQIE